MKSLKIRFFPVFVIGFIFSAVFISGCAPVEQEEERTISRVPVEAVTARSEKIQDSFTEIGEFNASQRVAVRAKSSGELLEADLEEGELIEKGQLIFRVDDRILVQEVQASKETLSEARVNLENAKKNYKRQKNLFQRGLAPRSTYDNVKANYDSLQARVRQLEAQLQGARERLDDAHIKAPFDGFVGEKMIDVGEFVNAGQALIMLYKTDPIEIDFSIPEKLVTRIEKGLPLEVQAEASGDRVFEGEVTFVGPEINRATRRLRVKGKIDNGGELKPGGFGRATVIFEVRENPVLPARALVAGRDGYVVYRIEEWQAIRQPVVTGLRQPGRVEILEGVSPGDLIVESGHQQLSGGEQVDVVENPSENERND